MEFPYSSVEIELNGGNVFLGVNRGNELQGSQKLHMLIKLHFLLKKNQ